MKKQKVIDGGISILFCILFFVVFMPIMAEISVFFRYQNTGRIFLEIDGNQETLNNIDITFKINNDLVEQGKIENGKFRFRQGEYGGNTCNFIIPAEYYGGQTDIVFKAEYISADELNINDFNIMISIKTGDEVQVYANGFVKAKGSAEEPYYFRTISKEVTAKDNVIGLTASGI